MRIKFSESGQNHNIAEAHNINGTYNIYNKLYHSIKVCENNVITRNEKLDEAIEGSIDMDKGGVIVLSTDVNAVRQDERKIVDFLKKKLSTYKNRLSYGKMINKRAKEFEDIYAWTIGKFLSGRYKSKDGTIFDENSISVELLGVSTDTLISFAESLCRDFKQETVLVKDYENGRILFVSGE